MSHDFTHSQTSGRDDHGRPMVDAALERAALYLAGAIDEGEQREFESALRDDRELRDAIERLAPAIELLAEAISIAPEHGDDPDGVRGGGAVDIDMLLAAIANESHGPASRSGVVREPTSTHDARRADVEAGGNRDDVQIWRAWNDSSEIDGLVTLRADEGAWEATGVPGVEVRRLFVDRNDNRMTAMFRMAPGAAWPQHRHDGFEECFVVSGDLHVGDELVMRAGDFQRAHGGSHHPKQWTEGGCVLLVSSSLHDELD